MLDIWSSKWMHARETRKKDMVIQDDNVAKSVRGIKSASRVRDEDDLYTKKFEDPDGIGDSFY